MGKDLERLGQHILPLIGRIAVGEVKEDQCLNARRVRQHDPDRVGNQPIHARIRERVTQRRKALVELPFLVDLAPRMAGIPRSLAGALVASALMGLFDDLTEGYAGYAGGTWDREWAGPTVVGLDALCLRWKAPTAELIRTRLADPETRERLNRRLAPRLRLAEAPLIAAPTRLHLEVRTPYAFKGSQYCQDHYLKHTLKKPRPELAVFDLAAQVKKKAIVQALEVETLPEGERLVRLIVKPEFDAKQFLQTAFAPAAPEDWVRLSARVTRVE